ncbi:MAG: SDR family NAD(P)-dependent oxidoreductase [Myxococcota bacterium]
MKKTILVTGSTDGIGLKAAELLAQAGHHVLLHGRNAEKAKKVEDNIRQQGGSVRTYIADLSRIEEVENLATRVADDQDALDVLINNAGVFKTSEPITTDGLDVRFVVNTIAPYLLTQRLLPLLGKSARVINLSSAAQAPVNLKALLGEVRLPDMEAYAQSKLALTMWSRVMGLSHGDGGPIVVSVNPGSMLGTKMVQQAFGVAGGDVRIGADILQRAALSNEFAAASGQYFDNDSRQFADPHPDALDPHKATKL